MTRLFERARAACDDARSAGPRELYWRGWIEAANRLGLRRRWFEPPQGAAFAAALPGPARSPEALRTWLKQRPSRFFFDPTDRARYQQLLEFFPAARTRADSLLHEAVLLFGHAVTLSTPWDWHADPVSGVRWPTSAHWSRLTIAGPAGSDVRRVWERNRQRDLFVLGRAYWATGDERYAEAAAERLDRWREANPPEQGINWWSNLEVALRAIAWIWAAHVFRDAPSFTPARLWELVRLCWLAGWHLEAGLAHSMRTMPGNHVIGDAAGLAVVALALPELADAPRWQTLALTTLEGEAEAQVSADGVHREESPAYHAFVWELLCLVALLARRQDRPVPGIWRALERMAEALVLTARPDGSLPASGDDDGSVGFDLCEGSARAFAVGATAAVLFDRPDLKAAVGGPVEAILWLCGPAGLDTWSALQASSPPAVRVTDFGLAVRSSWGHDADWWFLRGGTQSAHTHADALHLEVVVGGDLILEDSGTGSYSASVDWRRHARSTRAHNTIVLDGRDQARMHRTFRWISPLRVDWRTAGPFEGGQLADAAHVGYGGHGLSHRRRVWWRPDWGWLVLDCLDGRGTHDVELRWHTRKPVSRVGAGVQVGGRIDGPAALQIVTTPPLVLAIEPAREGRPEGWIAADYMTLEPGTVVCARARLAFPVAVATLLYRGGCDGPAAVSLDTTDAGSRIRLQISDRVLDLALPDGPRLESV
jgi:hypothetical protein